MGTRNLTCVIKDGEYKIAQYGQWAGYPTGQGQTIVEFLLKKGNTESLEKSLSKLRYLDREGIDKDFIEEYSKNAPDNRTPDQIKWWSLYMSRDIGAKILQAIAYSEDEEIIIANRINFANDSLFCEFAFVINLDTKELEVFKGFNTKPLGKTERFYSDEIPEEY